MQVYEVTTINILDTILSHISFLIHAHIYIILHKWGQIVHTFLEHILYPSFYPAFTDVSHSSHKPHS